MKIKTLFFNNNIDSKIVQWINSKYGVALLFIFAFSESIFFPIPVDVFLIAMAYTIPNRAIYFALITTVASVLGGLFGYLLGYLLYENILQEWLLYNNYQGSFNNFADFYNQYGILAIMIAGFTPIPYKIATIASGSLGLNVFVFLLFSFISRALRFFLVAYLIKKFHQKGKEIINKYFNWIITIVGIFIIMLVLFYLIYN